jgi:hypothetical protein
MQHLANSCILAYTWMCFAMASQRQSQIVIKHTLVGYVLVHTSKLPRPAAWLVAFQ